MIIQTGSQKISQLEERKGGYFYLQINAAVIDAMPSKRHTRIVCELDGQLSFRCGLNHLGDGNFFIILAQANLKRIGKSLGDTVKFTLTEDPDPLGVDVPEVLKSLLEQDPDLKARFEKLTLGKKRNVIHQINRIKDVDRQVSKAVSLIATANKPRPRRAL